jgi:phospholipase C
MSVVSKSKTAGLLTVTVVNGVGLDAADKDGFSDPYVILKVEGQEQKTKHVPNTLNPVWKQDFDFKIKNHEIAVLDIIVRDKNKILKDKDIGKATYVLKDLHNHDVLNVAIPLIACRGGTINLILKTSEDFLDEEILKSAPKSPQPQKRSNTVTHAHDPIKHVIVLCLENRSFDQMLGALTDLGLDGASDTHYCLDSSGVRHFQKPLNYAFNKEDVAHSHAFVLKQIAHDNSGFVTATQEWDETYRVPTYPERLDEVMGYFPGGTLPATHTLAKNFTVCDRWFASVPGETWPNRFFLMTGTSRGRVNMPDSKGVAFKPYIQKQPSIFDRLEDKKINYKIYYDDFALSMLLPRQWELEGLAQYRHMDRFYEACRGPAQDFPQFAFIEPRYGVNGNDDHAPHNMMNGQTLIADIYNAIRGNEELWNSCLFVITYDEHGGFYDHVPPPACIPPDEFNYEYTFDRYGVRVPTILVSPFVDRRVDHTVYDHTSILKYLVNKWGLEPLGERVAQANDFGKDLLQKPRPNCIEKIVVQHDHRLGQCCDEKAFNGLQKDTRKYLKRMIPIIGKEDRLKPLTQKVENWGEFTGLVNQIVHLDHH